MLIHEFGQQNEKVLLFFPGSCEPWQEFAYAARKLAARYHVLLVTPDGHNPGEGSDFLPAVFRRTESSSMSERHLINSKNGSAS